MRLKNIISSLGCLFAIISCGDKNQKEQIKPYELPKSDYSMYIFVESIDTTSVKGHIKSSIELEKYGFIDTTTYSIYKKWTVVKLDDRISPFMLNTLTSELSETNQPKYKEVFGVAISKTNKDYSFYIVPGTKMYNDLSGEYTEGYMNINKGFKLYVFDFDSLNFIFYPVDNGSLKIQFDEFIRNKGVFEFFNKKYQDV